jgi:prevent-host-death family protein
VDGRVRRGRAGRCERLCAGDTTHLGRADEATAAAEPRSYPASGSVYAWCVAAVKRGCDRYAICGTPPFWGIPSVWAFPDREIVAALLRQLAEAPLAPAIPSNHNSCYSWCTMTENVSTAHIRQRIGELLDRVALRRDEFIIERKGKPMAALVSVERLQQLTRLARQGLRDLLERQQASSLTESGAAALAVEAQNWARRAAKRKSPAKK